MGEVAHSQLLKKGAEASLFLVSWHGKKAIIKARLPKKYRPEALDAYIRRYRTLHEPQLLHEAKKAGVSTPIIYLVDITNAAITMEFVEGIQVKKLLACVSHGERHAVCFKIGELIGKLHNAGIIHGDLTTSNMIMGDKGKIFIVDFGLGEKSSAIEARGVDLHLLKRALQSTHYEFADECYESIIEGYKMVVGAEKTNEILNKINEIEKRGRYVAERKEKTL